MDQKKATASVLASGILWGLISIFVRALSAAGLSSLQITTVRMVVGAAGMLLVLLAGDIFDGQPSRETVEVGVQYLRTEGACYIGIGILFMLYGYYRAVNKPVMSVVLTVFSLGTRVLLANVLSAVSEVGVFGIWISIPIGWFLADAVGIAYFAVVERRRLNKGGSV